LGGRRILARQQTLVSAVELPPQGHSHDRGSGDENAEKDGLVARDHG
jgi:hypothetical protein